MNLDASSFNAIARSRRSTFPKQFAEKNPVQDEVIEQIMLNALHAPSHGHLQPWKFIVYSGKGLQKLADFQSELYKQTSGEKFKEQTFETLRTNPLKASHVVAICLKRDPNKKFPETEEICAVACAVQNIYLSVTAYGLGGYWTTGGITYNQKAKPFFGLDEDDKLLGFFYIGNIAVASPAKSIAPFEEKLSWIKQ